MLDFARILPFIAFLVNKLVQRGAQGEFVRKRAFISRKNECIERVAYAAKTKIRAHNMRVEGS